MAEASALFMWVVVSFFLFALLDPLAERLKARGFTSVSAAAILVLGSTIIVGTVVFFVAQLSHNMIVELEDSKRIFVGYYRQLDHKWHSIASSVQQVTQQKQTEPLPSASDAVVGGDVGGTLVKGLGGAVTILTYSVLTPFLCFFFLADRDLFRGVFSNLFSNRARGTEMWNRIVVALRAYFLGNLMLGLVSFPFFLILFMLFGVPSSMTLAALSSLFNLVPFLGAVLVGFLPALTLLGQGDHAVSSLVLYLLCIIVHLAVANFVTPKVLGSKVDINSTVSMIALVGLGELWGGVGLVLGIPIMASIKIVFEYSGSEWLEWMASLMSESKAMKRHFAGEPVLGL
jgi:predicted PurR-regulated permease PerM